MLQEHRILHVLLWFIRDVCVFLMALISMPFSGAKSSHSCLLVLDVVRRTTFYRRSTHLFTVHIFSLIRCCI